MDLAVTVHHGLVVAERTPLCWQRYEVFGRAPTPPVIRRSFAGDHLDITAEPYGDSKEGSIRQQQWFMQDVKVIDFGWLGSGGMRPAGKTQRLKKHKKVQRQAIRLTSWTDITQRTIHQ